MEDRLTFEVASTPDLSRGFARSVSGPFWPFLTFYPFRDTVTIPSYMPSIDFPMRLFRLANPLRLR